MNIQAPVFAVAIVEDDPSVREALRSLLTSAGYAVLAFESATAFLAEHEAHAISCLLVDAQMPVLSGLSLQKRLLDMNVSIPIIFVTGRADEVRELALERGAIAVLAKPFAADELLDAIQSAIRGTRGQQPPA
jgi:FixJ family two-component response regulator